MNATIPPLRSIRAPGPAPRGVQGRHPPWSARLWRGVAGWLSGANRHRALARGGQPFPWPWVRARGFPRAGGPRQATVHRRRRDGDGGRLATRGGRWRQPGRAARCPGTAPGLDGLARDGNTRRGARRLGAADAQRVRACCQRWPRVVDAGAVPDARQALAARGPRLARLPRAGATVPRAAPGTPDAVASPRVHPGGAALLGVQGTQPPVRADIPRATAWPARRWGPGAPRAWAPGRIERRRRPGAAAPASAGPPARQGRRIEPRTSDQRTGPGLATDPRSAVPSLPPEQARPRARWRWWRPPGGLEHPRPGGRAAGFGAARSTTRTDHAPQARAVGRHRASGRLHPWRRPASTAAREHFASHPAGLFRWLGWAPPGS
jgi:hypothetical protein